MIESLATTHSTIDQPTVARENFGGTYTAGANKHTRGGPLLRQPPIPTSPPVPPNPIHGHNYPNPNPPQLFGATYPFQFQSQIPLPIENEWSTHQPSLAFDPYSFSSFDPDPRLPNFKYYLLGDQGFGTMDHSPFQNPWAEGSAAGDHYPG